MATKKLEIAPLPMAVSHTKEELMVMFKELLDVVDAELSEMGDCVPPNAAKEGIAAALDMGNRSVSALEKREDFKQLLFDHEYEVKRIRLAVQRAEDTARRVDARREFLKGALLEYMTERGILEIPCSMGYFKVGNQPDKLVIDDEGQIPPEYFDQEAVINVTLNRDRLTAVLDSGKEVAGVHLEKNRKNLLIR